MTISSDAGADLLRWEVEPDADVRTLIDPLLERLVMTPGGWPEEKNGDWSEWTVVKFGPQAFVFSRAADARDIYLKWLPPYFTSSRRRGLAIWPTPAHKHVEWTRRAEAAGIPCAAILAAGAMPRRLLSLRQPPCFVATSSPAGTQTLAHYLFENSADDAERRRYADAVRKIADALRAHGICRGDIRPPNLLRDPGGATLRLFDFDSFCPERAIAPWRRRRRMQRDEQKVQWTIRMILGEEPMPDHWKTH